MHYADQIDRIRALTVKVRPNIQADRNTDEVVELGPGYPEILCGFCRVVYIPITYTVPIHQAEFRDTRSI